jgi:hypothetical protein
MKIISDKEHKLLLILSATISVLFVAQLLPQVRDLINDYFMRQRFAEEGISIGNCFPEPGIPLPRYFIFLILPLIYKAKTFFFSTLLTCFIFISYYYEFTHSNRNLGFLDYSIFALTSILFFWQFSIIFRIIARHFQSNIQYK